MNRVVVEKGKVDLQNKTIIDKVLNFILDTFTFKVALLIAMFFYLFPFTVQIMSKGMKVFLIWGAVVFLMNIFQNFKALKNKVFILLFLFFAFSAIGVLANYKHNFMLNIVDYAYMITFTFNLLIPL